MPDLRADRAASREQRHRLSFLFFQRTHCSPAAKRIQRASALDALCSRTAMGSLEEEKAKAVSLLARSRSIGAKIRHSVWTATIKSAPGFDEQPRKACRPIETRWPNL